MDDDSVEFIQINLDEYEYVRSGRNEVLAVQFSNKHILNKMLLNHVELS